MGKRKTRYPGVVRLSEGRFLVRIQTRKHPRTGRRKEVKKVVNCCTVQEAFDARKALLQELLGGCDQAKKMTLRAYAHSWLASKTLRLAFSTAGRYATALDLHIIPALGDLYLNALTRRDVEDWMVFEARKHQPRSVNGWLRILKTLLGDACDEFQFPNPAARVKPLPEPQMDEDDPNALTETELAALLEAFRNHQPRHFPLVFTIALTGLRMGEATALKWKDMDQEAGIIRVRRAHYRGRIKEIKTKRPRIVPLPEELALVLMDWRHQMLASQHPGLKEGWCFPSNKGKPRSSNVMTKPMRICIKKAKISKRVTIQGLRRSAEDVLRRLGVAGPLAEALMGHNERMRSRYSTVDVLEVAALGPRMVKAIGVPMANVVPNVVPSAPEKENASSAGDANEAFSKALFGAGDGI